MHNYKFFIFFTAESLIIYLLKSIVAFLCKFQRLTLDLEFLLYWKIKTTTILDKFQKNVLLKK